MMHLLRTVLAKSAKDSASVVQPLKFPRSTSKLQKHLTIVLKRIKAGGDLVYGGRIGNGGSSKGWMRSWEAWDGTGLREGGSLLEQKFMESWSWFVSVFCLQCTVYCLLYDTVLLCTGYNRVLYSTVLIFCAYLYILYSYITVRWYYMARYTGTVQYS